MKRILIVEDEAFIAELIEVILSGKGFDVACARNGLEALEKLDKLDPDLILTDNMMPLLDGVGLCRAIRKRAGYEALPIIMMSAGRRPPESGALIDAFIEKPFLVDDLVQAVRSGLDGSRARGTA